MKNNIQKITHILCDLSDVLIKGIEGSEIPLAKEIGLDEKKVSEELFSYNFRPLWLGKINEYDFASKLIKEKNWDISTERFLEIIKENFQEIKGVKDVYLRLKKKYTLILLSVNAKEWVNYLDKKYNYSGLFDKVVYSFDIGYTKREPESFAYVLDILKISPEKLFLIDDSSRNLAVAEALGIKGIKFLDAKQLKDSLSNLNII